LRRGISVLNGGAFERLFCPEGRNLNKPIVKSSNAQGGGGGGGRMLKLQFGWYIILGPFDLEKPKMILIGSTVKYKIK